MAAPESPENHQFPLFYLIAAACIGVALGGGVATWLFLKGAPLIIPIVIRPQSSEPPRTGRRRLQRATETTSGPPIGRRRRASLLKNRDGPRARR